MTILETIRFRLRDGFDDEDFIGRNQRVEHGYMEHRPGFLSRRTAHSEDGEWLVFVQWATLQDAQATIESFMQAPESKEFLEAVDPSTVAQARYELIDS
jgi:heme-degrading monooxygenase HmoA